jgi:hypothetical protein
MRHALELLARLEKQVLERERLGLRTIEGEIGQCWRELERLDAALAAELGVAWTLPGGPAPFGAYAAAAGARRQQTTARLEALERGRVEAEAGLRRTMRRYKTLEITTERLQARALDRLRRREEAMREEAALLRLAQRPGSPA